MAAQRIGPQHGQKSRQTTLWWIIWSFSTSARSTQPLSVSPKSISSSTINLEQRGFCSSLLVNAISAIGARFSDLAEARLDLDDRYSAGEQFFNKAQRLLSIEATPTVVTIQALNLMSLRQASSGKDESGWHYARHVMRIALDLDLQDDDPNQEPTNPTGFSRAERQECVATSGVASL
jgi:hypothetical protein